MPERICDHLRVYSPLQTQRRVAVPEVMEPNLREPCRLGKPPELSGHVVGPDWAAVPPREHVAPERRSLADPVRQRLGKTVNPTDSEDWDLELTAEELEQVDEWRVAARQRLG